MMGEYTFLNRNQYVETSQPIEEKKKKNTTTMWDGMKGLLSEK